MQEEDSERKLSVSLKRESKNLKEKGIGMFVDWR